MWVKNDLLSRQKAVVWGDCGLQQEVTHMVHAEADRFDVSFDDERAVVNAGIVLPATLGQRLGLEQLVDGTVDLGARPGAARPGRKVLSLVHAMLLGADSIDDPPYTRGESCCEFTPDDPYAAQSASEAQFGPSSTSSATLLARNRPVLLPYSLPPSLRLSSASVARARAV